MLVSLIDVTKFSFSRVNSYLNFGANLPSLILNGIDTAYCRVMGSLAALCYTPCAVA